MSDDASFIAAFRVIVGEEGGYSIEPSDSGNWTGGARNSGELKGTKFGISARSYPQLDIASLTLEDARAIYARDYWQPPRCPEMPWCWALAVFDANIQHGKSRAVMLAQKSLGLVQDGVVGDRTLKAMAAAPAPIFDRHLAQRGVWYSMLDGWRDDREGWLDRLFTLHRAALTSAT